jgi:hypothetical protein
MNVKVDIQQPIVGMCVWQVTQYQLPRQPKAPARPTHRARQAARARQNIKIKTVIII